MVYGIYNELVTGAFVNQLITGGPHIVLTLPHDGMTINDHKCRTVWPS